MLAYELKKQINSTFVSLSLLQEIERYLLEQGKSQCNEDSRIKYTATIYDKYGEDNIDSFEKYHRSTLPNEARRINLIIYDYKNDFRIEVSFSREALYSYLNVQVSGNTAKEKAIGIANTIEFQLNEHKNINFIFHSWLSYFMPAPFGGAVTYLIPSLISKKIDIGTLTCFIIIFIVLVYFCLKIVNPYSVLDTNRNRQIASYVKWILNGLAGVFLFGLLAALVRKYLIGF